MNFSFVFDGKSSRLMSEEAVSFGGDVPSLLVEIHI